MSDDIVSIRDLRFLWPDSTFELTLPTLNVCAGSSVVVTGPSGSGKTTLLNLLSGILVADQGTIEVDGQPLSALSDRERRRFRLQRVGLIFQTFELISYLNVVDNILLPVRISPDVPLTVALKQRASDLLKRVGLEGCERRAVTRLSQGECQRVALCRALLLKPRLLLADEPTGNLDPDNSRRILEILLEQVQQENATLIMVTHDHSLLSHFDTTIDFLSLLNAASAAGGPCAS